MEVIIRPDADKAAELTSRLIEARLRAKPDLVLGLATGRTMERVYDKLVAKHQSEGLDFSQCRTFNLDEYIGVPPGDEHSYRFT
jgi:glucosamine-6-phosphate deaminase